MTMILDALLLIVGMAIVMWGADKFTEGASSVARRWKVSEMVIGLTIVSMGTSMPEFVVSFFSALNGKADMSVGNVVGSNIFNTLIIVGMSALMISMSLTKKLLTRDILFVILSSLILASLSYDGNITRADGFILLLCFGMYMIYSFYVAKNEPSETEAGGNVYGWSKTLLYVVLGLGCLIGGGQLLVDSATKLAIACGMSERVVGLTILAAGTSLPELATSIVAARKGSKGIALGNAIGSNLFNILFILGTSSFICPLSINGIGLLDWVVLIGSAIVLFIFGGTEHKITKAEGAVMILIYLLYMTALVMGWQITWLF
jgi:cation:H+ antiporter